MELLIPVASGLEQITKRQLFSLGYEKAPAENGRIFVEGDWLDIARLNVFLRSGERVLIKLASFKATTFEELFDKKFLNHVAIRVGIGDKILCDLYRSTDTDINKHTLFACVTNTCCNSNWCSKSHGAWAYNDKYGYGSLHSVQYTNSKAK